MNLVSIEPPAARVALTRELLKLLNAALGIVSAGYRLQIIADQLIETLAESLGFLSRASYELLVDREGDVHLAQYMWTRVMCQLSPLNSLL